MLVLAATQPIGISTQKWRMICWRRVSATIIMKKKKMPTESHIIDMCVLCIECSEPAAEPP